MRDVTKEALMQAMDAIDRACKLCLMEAIETPEKREVIVRDAVQPLVNFKQHIADGMLNAQRWDLMQHNVSVNADGPQPVQVPRGPAW